MKNVAIIGLGLIGGSLAVDIKKAFDCTIVGIDASEVNAKRALEIGFIDEIGTLENVKQVDVVVIATPVNTIGSISNEVLDLIGDDTLIFDAGSVKGSICSSIAKHKNRKNYLAAHPIAGTEYSGPNAAISDLFRGKVNIICELEKTDRKIANKAFEIFDALGMEYKYMSAVEHDRHIAYVSHLSHVSSFMLGKTVLEIEKDEQNIFDMAGSGFESTVRLAKSAASTWTPIFTENKKNLLSSLEQYIKNLNEFKTYIEEENTNELNRIMTETNHLREILNNKI